MHNFYKIFLFLGASFCLGLTIVGLELLWDHIKYREFGLFLVVLPMVIFTILAYIAIIILIFQN